MASQIAHIVKIYFCNPVSNKTRTDNENKCIQNFLVMKKNEKICPVLPFINLFGLFFFHLLISFFRVGAGFCLTFLFQHCPIENIIVNVIERSEEDAE
jgi:hypothetical protein